MRTEKQSDETSEKDAGIETRQYFKRKACRFHKADFKAGMV